MSTAPTPITTKTELEQTAEQLRAAGWFALDTEFIRETTYWPRLCLIQVATDDILALIDPLALDELDALLDVLFDTSVTKVLHAAAQDLEIFHHMTGQVPEPVFDTQIAAPLLGFPEQAGFAHLVEALLSTQLGKSQARTDWSERPLPGDALAYAADDVRYLVPLYHRLYQGLAERGRLDWLEPEFARLTDSARYERPVADAWRRLKGVDRLPAAGRAVAQALAQWREDRARAEDVPRKRVLQDDALVDIARAQPRTRKQLRRLRSVRADAIQRDGDALLELVARARERSPPAPNDRASTPALDEAGEALVDAMSALVRLEAAEHALNATTLAGRKSLARLARGEAVAEVLKGWRYRVVGETLEAFLHGHAAMACGSDGALTLRSCS